MKTKTDRRQLYSLRQLVPANRSALAQLLDKNLEQINALFEINDQLRGKRDEKDYFRTMGGVKIYSVR